MTIIRKYGNRKSHYTDTVQHGGTPITIIDWNGRPTWSMWTCIQRNNGSNHKEILETPTGDSKVVREVGRTTHSWIDEDLSFSNVRKNRVEAPKTSATNFRVAIKDQAVESLRETPSCYWKRKRRSEVLPVDDAPLCATRQLNEQEEPCG